MRTQPQIPTTMNTPFSTEQLINRSLLFLGVSELLWHVSPYDLRMAAEEVEAQYSDWNESEGFSEADLNFAVQQFLSSVIYFGKLSHKIHYNPTAKGLRCLEVVAE